MPRKSNLQLKLVNVILYVENIFGFCFLALLKFLSLHSFDADINTQAHAYRTYVILLFFVFVFAHIQSHICILLRTFYKHCLIKREGKRERGKTTFMCKYFKPIFILLHIFTFLQFSLTYSLLQNGYIDYNTA